MLGKIRKISVYLCLIAGIALTFNGCATLFKGTSDNVNLSSEPAGAKVYVNGNLMGTTPVKLKLKSSDTYQIEFKKNGYTTKTYNLTNHVGAGWIVLDVLGGLVPIIVDAATNSWYKLDQSNFNAVLASQQP
ncbi:MAG TPA: PEGA domain-containing protein [Balneolales bacterium]|nr:PEGA domain-containing protein [Balneolales bacterium]